MDLLPELIEHSSWPIAFLIALLMFRTPISRLLQRLKLFNVKGVEAQFINDLEAQGLSEENLEQLRSLTATDINLFLLTSFSDDRLFSYSTEIPVEEFRNSINNLVKAGLLEVKEPDETGKDIRHLTTPLGNRLRAMSVNTLAKLIHESPNKPA